MASKAKKEKKQQSFTAGDDIVVKIESIGPKVDLENPSKDTGQLQIIATHPDGFKKTYFEQKDASAETIIRTIGANARSRLGIAEEIQFSGELPESVAALVGEEITFERVDVDEEEE